MNPFSFCSEAAERDIHPKTVNFFSDGFTDDRPVVENLRGLQICGMNTKSYQIVFLVSLHYLLVVSMH